MEISLNNLKLIINNSYDGIFIVDRDRKIIYGNKAAENLTGYSNSDLIGDYCYEKMINTTDSNGMKSCEIDCPAVKSMRDNEIKEVDAYFYHKDGDKIPIFLKVLPYKNENNEIIGAIEIFSENSQRKQVSEKIKNLEKLVMLDELTKIPNRRYLENIIEIKLNEYLLNEVKFGLIFMDIDNFKEFNDNYGHDIGDLVLKTISKTFSNNLRGDDIIGRWGGEEFVAVCSVINIDNLKKLAEKLRILVENTFIEVNNKKLRVTISVGAAIVTPEDNINTLIKKSDTLLYKSKRNMKNCITAG